MLRPCYARVRFVSFSREPRRPGPRRFESAEHDLTPEDIEPIVLNPDRLSVSRSSGRPIAFGFTDNGREIAVVYEQIDEYTVYPITAFEVGA